MAEETIILRPSPLKWLLVAAGCAAFVAIGVWLLSLPDKGSDQTAGWCGVFFGLGLVVALLNLMPGASYLKLGPEGFVLCAMWRKRAYLWSDVTGFGVTSVQAGLRRQKMVGFSFAPDAPQKGKSKTLRKMNVGLSGYEAALNDNYGMEYEKLAALMNSYWQRFHSQR